MLTRAQPADTEHEAENVLYQLFLWETLMQDPADLPMSLFNDEKGLCSRLHSHLRPLGSVLTAMFQYLHLPQWYVFEEKALRPHDVHAFVALCRIIWAALIEKNSDMQAALDVRLSRTPRPYVEPAHVQHASPGQSTCSSAQGQTDQSGYPWGLKSQQGVRSFYADQQKCFNDKCAHLRVAARWAVNSAQ